ncbi:MAG TPA: O-antigen ligase family protein, partial [Gemmatimonadaceae bacterium]|nr:O-antigen ligase family protein [Gemmatimonadaceae bacterium]
MPSYAPSRLDRAALVLVQLGAIAVVLAALPYKSFDLDRFLVPKELALHLVATAAALLCLTTRQRLSVARVDWLLGGFLVLGAVSAVLAPNHWNAERALAISWSSAVLFWVARTLRRGGAGRALLWGLAIAGTLGAVTALAQAYGLRTEYFSLNRSPGGTFGNRNFMAHLGAIIAPTIVLCALTARRTAGTLVAALLLAIVAASQVLSRSRAAWLALLAAGIPLAVAAWLTRERWAGRGTGRRLVVLMIAAGIGAVLALVLPNALEWKSDNPYLESVTGIVNYQEGSGHGRLVQYTNSLHMALAHPVLGVGPGNWPVMYPRYASRGDPSLTSADEGMTSNPWPSSDWVAFIAERGLPATALLALTLLALLALAGWHARVGRGPDALLGAFALAGTVIATVVVGALDAVLLIAPPALFVWALLGALVEPLPTSRKRAVARGVPQWAPVVVFAIGAVAIVRSAFQTAAMATYTGATRLSTLQRAALFDPGSYRIQLRLAQAELDRGHCESARDRAHAARGL